MSVITLLLITSPVLAAEHWLALDGDTLLHTVTGRRVTSTERIRLIDVDAPEMHGKCDAERAAAEEARAFVQIAVDQAKEVVVEKSVRRDRYGRTLAVVRLDGVSLSAMLLEAGLARPYHGEKRQPWCS